MSIKPLVSQEVSCLIESRLEALANEQQIKILHACESGSRAWGFPSPDSDYDVRFVYVHTKSWYLTLEEGPDVIDLPLEDSPVGLLDIGGWDVRKTLRLLRKSNPAIWEWLQSPVTYQTGQSNSFRELPSTLDPFYSPISACHHYLSLCRKTMERELSGTQVKIKKYFYMLRPLLAAVWIERYQTVPPMELAPLLGLLDNQPDIKICIDDLLKRKQHTDEQVPIDRIAVLDDYLTRELNSLQHSAKKLPTAQADVLNLDRLFQQCLDI